jgi:Na+/phosphate symporter
LPLSTTYVTFMVAMGSSLSDQAWGRESAVYRVTGVLTVIGGWFFTAMMAFGVSSLFALAIYYGRAPVVVIIAILALALIARTHLLHRKREKDEQAADVFNLRKVKDAVAATDITFEHAGILLREVSRVLGQASEGLFENNRAKLRKAKADQRSIQRWSNIIAANTFKVMRLLEWEDVSHPQRYRRTISSLQEISESVRDVVMRAHVHVENQHASPLAAQVAEMDTVRQEVQEILDRTSSALLKSETPDVEAVSLRVKRLRTLLQKMDRAQIKRIQDNVSKTRLSILFYAYLSDSMKIVEHTTNLLTVFQSLIQPQTNPDDAGDNRRQSVASV